jgi:hypothetical protein
MLQQGMSNTTVDLSSTGFMSDQANTGKTRALRGKSVIFLEGIFSARRYEGYLFKRLRELFQESGPV